MDTYTRNGIKYSIQDEEYSGIVIITRKREIDEFESNKKVEYVVVKEVPLLQDIDNGTVKHYEGLSKLRGYPTFSKMMHAKKFIDGITDKSDDVQ